jgi:hypothetical protein
MINFYITSLYQKLSSNIHTYDSVQLRIDFISATFCISPAEGIRATFLDNPTVSPISFVVSTGVQPAAYLKELSYSLTGIRF